MSGLLLDTQVWLWVQCNHTAELTPELIALLEAAQREGALHASAASLLELGELIAAGQVELGMSTEQFLQSATEDGGLQILPLSDRILVEAGRIQTGDIVDRMLIATAREHGLTLLTRDTALLESSRAGQFSARRF